METSENELTWSMSQRGALQHVLVRRLGVNTALCDATLRLNRARHIGPNVKTCVRCARYADNGMVDEVRAVNRLMVGGSYDGE